MRKWISLFAVLALFVGMAGAPAFAQSKLFPDPCNAGFSQTKSVAINVSSATTTSLVAPVTGQTITVCGLWLNSVGGTSTLEYGTGATCGTGTQVMTGPLAAATTVSIFPSGGSSVLQSTPVSQRLCILSGSSTSATAGWLLYVQQ